MNRQPGFLLNLMFIVGIFIGILTGCTQTTLVYDLKMKVEGGKLKRSIFCGQKNTSLFVRKEKGRKSHKAVPEFPETKLKQIASEYGLAETPRPAVGKFIFQGVFSENTPNDVGGGGRFFHGSTNLGSTTFYAERFVGNDNAASSIRDRFDAADEFAHFIDEWLKTKLGEKAGWENIHQYVVGPMAEDIVNAGLFLWLPSARENTWRQGSDEYEEPNGPDFVARLLLYFAERDYFSPNDVPGIYGALKSEGSEEQRFSAFFHSIREPLAKKLALPKNAPILDELGNMLSPEKSEESLRAFSKHWKKSVAKGEETADREEVVSPPEDIPSELLSRAVGIQSLFNLMHIELSAVFEADAAPFHTNGQWDEKKKQIVWKGEVRDGAPLPSIAYAIWATPTVAAQQKHFGKVVLKDENLAQYVLWRESLSSEHKNKWEAFLASLGPDSDLPAAIASFSFSEETESRGDSAITIKDLLLSSLAEPQTK